MRNRFLSFTELYIRLFIIWCMPLPVANLFQILTIFSDVLLVFYKLIVHLLDQIRSTVVKLWQMHDRILYKVETVDLVLNSHIEWSCDRTFLLITMNRYVLVVTTIGQLMDQCWVTMECKDYRLILCEDCIVLTVAQSMWMLMIRLQLEQIDYVDNADLKLWKLISKDSNCCHCLQCRCIATACHNDIRLLSFIVTSPPWVQCFTACSMFNHW